MARENEKSFFSKNGLDVKGFFNVEKCYIQGNDKYSSGFNSWFMGAVLLVNWKYW